MVHHTERFSENTSANMSAQPNIQGFLKHRSEWNENTAVIIAEREGLTLTAKHWDVIHFLRTEFYVNNGTVPLAHDIKRCMEREWKTSLSYSELANMFPGGLNIQGAKIAGCITMKTVDDLLKVKGDAVWSVKPDQAVIDALKIMSEKNIGALMVVENDKLVGIVSERDFTRNVVLQDRSPSDTKVMEIMSGSVISVVPEDTLDHCMAIMTEKGFRHLPVLDYNGLAGVLSMPDLVRIIVEQQQFTIAQLEDGAGQVKNN